MPFRPSEITRQHVLDACAKIKRENIQLRPSTRNDVIVNGEPFPPIEVLRYAHEQLDGEKRWDFHGGPQSFKLLEKLGFSIRRKLERKYWIYAPGPDADHWDEFYDAGIMALSWDELGDLEQYVTKNDIAAKLRTVSGSEGNKTNDALANYEFRDVMQVGDVVIAKQGRSTYLGYGIVTSGYRFEASRKSFKSIRNIDWKRKGNFHETDGPIVMKTLTDITKYPDYVYKLKSLMEIDDDSPNFWFVCQGSTFNERQGKKYLYAGNVAKDGRIPTHWSNMKRVRPGDIIFNYASKAVRGISIAKKAQKEYEGTRVDIDFFEFDEPLPYDPTLPWAIDVKRLTQGINGPIDVTGRIKQGYLFEFNLDAARSIRMAYGKPFPQLIEDIVGISKSIPGQLGEIYPNAIGQTNRILYGPPGTGKTYNSIDTAVEITDGNVPADRESTKNRFDELRQLGQIEFVTFHQNYSYEDFMVGIRPDVDNENLRFLAEKGIFYRVSKRARANYEESKVGKGRRSFDDVLLEILEPLERGEDVPVKMASGISFKITEVSDKSLSFIKQSGGKDHTLSISTLRDVVEGARDVPGGLDSYYKPLVKLIQQKRETTQPAEKLKNYVLVIDEINRANISKVFGELITLLEEDKRIGRPNELKVTLPNGEKDFGIPPNLYLIGTMNTADKSIALIDIALRRRFEFIGYYPKYDLIDAEAANLLREINDQIYKIKNSADYLIGHAYFMTDAPIEAVLRNKVVPLLMEYLGGKTDVVKRIFDGTEWSVSFNTETYNWDISRK